MTRQTSRLSGQKGFVLVYMAATLTTLLLFAGLAVDTGRAYVVKAQLTKAVDGAALAAARSLNSGVPGTKPCGCSSRTSRPAISEPQRSPTRRPPPASSAWPPTPRPA